MPNLPDRIEALCQAERQRQVREWEMQAVYDAGMDLSEYYDIRDEYELDDDIDESAEGDIDGDE